MRRVTGETKAAIDMDSTGLAALSNLVLYGAMGVLALAMIAFAVHVGVATTRRSARRPAPAERELAGVGARDGGYADGPGQAVADAGATVAVAADADADTASPAGSGGSGGGGADEPPRDRAGSLGVTLSWLGTMFLGLSIALRGLSVQRPPVANMFEFAVAAAFLVMLIYLALGLTRPIRWLGLFVAFPVLLVLGLAITVWYTAASELVPSLKSTWIVIHVPVAILATAIFTLGFVVLLLHLAQGRREQRRAEGATTRSSFLDALPNAAALDRIAYSLNVVAFPLWTFTLIAGAIWGQQAWGTYWSWDPKEVWTFVIWVIYAAYLHARATSGWSLRTANVIAVVGYLAIIVNFTIVNYFFPGMHSYSGLVTS